MNCEMTSKVMYGIDGVGLANTLQEFPVEGFTGAIEMMTISPSKCAREFCRESIPYQHAILIARISKWLKTMIKRQHKVCDIPLYHRMIIVPEIGGNGKLHYHGIVWAKHRASLNIILNELQRYCRRNIGFCNTSAIIYNQPKWEAYICKDVDKTPLSPFISDLH